MKPLYEVLSDGRWKFHLDHHKLSTFTLCERLFEFKHFRNLRRRGGASFAMSVGIWWSDVMSDLYDGIAVNQQAGKDVPPNLVTTLVNAAGHWQRLEMKRFAQLAPVKYKTFGGEQKIALSGFDSEAFVDFPVGALLMTKEYYDHRALADARHWRILATETAFGVLDDLIIGGNSKVIVAYQGRPDIIALDSGNRLMPLDHKTKDYPDPAALMSEYKPHPQTAGYVYTLNQLIKELGITNRIVDRCQIIVSGRMPPRTPRDKNKPPYPRFAQIPVSYSQAELEEWREQTIAKASHLRESIERHMMLIKESSCHYQYGAPCEFRNVCANPPGVREMLLKNDFEIMQPWDTSAPQKRNVTKV